MKKLSLEDLFYDLAFDNAISAQINEFIESKGENKPVPVRSDIREWAKETAKKFK